MKILPADPHQTRTLVLSTGAALSERQLANHFLAASGSFAHRPAVEQEISVIFDVLERVAERLRKHEPAAA